MCVFVGSENNMGCLFCSFVDEKKSPKTKKVNNINKDQDQSHESTGIYNAIHSFLFLFWIMHFSWFGLEYITDLGKKGEKYEMGMIKIVMKSN